MNLRAYVTDSSNYESNNIEISGITKLIIRNGHLLVWSADDNMKNAGRFKHDEQSQVLQAPDLPFYCLPLKAVADLHIDQQKILLLPSLPSGSSSQAPEYIRPGENKPVDLEKELQDMVSRNVATQRSSNKILEIARKLKCNNLSDFLGKVSEAQLRKITGCGANTIHVVSIMAQKHALQLREQ